MEDMAAFVERTARILPAATRSVARRAPWPCPAHLKKSAIHLDDAVDTYEFAQYDGFAVNED
jgi:hypothetical protein